MNLGNWENHVYDLVPWVGGTAGDGSSVATGSANVCTAGAGGAFFAYS
jgi:hypothetical protein